MTLPEAKDRWRVVLTNIVKSWFRAKETNVRTRPRRRVLLDGYWLVSGPPSGRNVVSSLIKTWPQTWPDDDITVLVPQRDLVAAATTLANLRVRLRPVRIRPHGLAVLLLSLSREHYDIAVTQNFTPLFSSVPNLTFLHDAIFARSPQWFSLAERAYFSLIPFSALFAYQVLTSSKSESLWIAATYPKLATRTRVVGLAPAIDFEESAPVRPPAVCTHHAFILTVGRLNIRKNIDLLVQALERNCILSESLQLIIVGERDGKSSNWSEVSKRAIQDGRVRLIGNVTDGELKWLYAASRCFVFPSLDEAFGLPAVEAHRAGAPIALSAIPAFKEFGDIGVFFDPCDHESIGIAVRACLEGAGGRVGSERPCKTWNEIVRCIGAEGV